MNYVDPFVTQLQEVAKLFMFRKMQSVIKYSKASGLSMSHIGALMHLHNTGASDVSGIGDKLGITYPAVSQMLDRLVDEGLIMRTEDPDDRRSKKIVLTEKGTNTLLEGMKAHQASFIEMSEKLTGEEKAKLKEAFDLLLEKFNEIDTHPKSEKK
jgi:DNA-binding MarR family transcriptional regulator